MSFEDLNVIVVNYRTPELTRKCVDSIVTNGIALPQHIVIVDNSSIDGSTSELCSLLPKNVTNVVSCENFGFGYGVNYGATYCEREFILVLNPDTYFLTNTVRDVLRVFRENEAVGVVGLDLVNPDLSKQYSARRFYSFLDILGRRVKCVRNVLKEGDDRHLMKAEMGAGLLFDANWVMGTGFVVRRDLFAAIGGMDQGYFLYMEDVDFCARVWKYGKRVVCLPNATLVHDHQRSSAKSPFSFVGRQHLKSLFRFRSKFSVPLFRSPDVHGICK